MASVQALVERAKVRLMVRATWRRSRASLLASLRNFAETEADSAWHLMRAAEAATRPEQKAELFGQVLEEQHHAAEFARIHREVARETGGGHLVPLRLERKPLVTTAAELWRFFVYCSVGEGVAATRFKNIHDALGDEARDAGLKKVLRDILRDEAQHVHSADELAGDSAVPAAALAREARRIKARRLWEAWLRSGRLVTDALATALLALVYFVVGALGHGPARRRLAGGLAPVAGSDARALPLFPAREA